MEKFEDISRSPESNFETHQEILNIVEKIEEISDSKTIPVEEKIRDLRELVRGLLEHMHDDFNMELSVEVSQLYEEMHNKDLLARVEKIKNVIECMANHKPINVGDEDHHYANSVTTDKEGLRIAMAEAEAIGPVRLLLGLDLNALIGFTNDHIKVTEIDDDQFDLRDTSLRKAHCRHIVGEIHFEDIKYVVLRIPRNLFPDNELTKEETTSKSPFIFRGARIDSRTEIAEPLQVAA